MKRNALDDQVLELLQPYAHPRYPVGRNSVSQLLVKDRELLLRFLSEPRSRKKAVERPIYFSPGQNKPQYDYRTKMWKYFREGWNLHLKDYDRATIPVLEATANYVERQRG